jgi:ElaB/YqjD/DUF883 family membrane-anchored ribosome-binding protein
MPFWVEGLEAKLKAKIKALEEAQAQLAANVATHKEELAAAKNAASQAVKEAQERAAKAEEALMKNAQEQTKCEETTIIRLNDLWTSFGSKYPLSCDSLFSLLFVCVLTRCSMMQHKGLAKPTRCVKTKPKIPYLTPLKC